MVKAVVIEDSEKLTTKQNKVGSNPFQAYGSVGLLHTRSDEMLQNLEQHQQLLYMNICEQPKFDFLATELERSKENIPKNDREQENGHPIKKSEEVRKEILNNKTFETWKWFGQNERESTKGRKEADSSFGQKEFVLEKQIKNLKTIMESREEIREKQGTVFERIKKAKDISGAMPLSSAQFHATISNKIQNTDGSTLPLELRYENAIEKLAGLEKIIGFRERRTDEKNFFSLQQDMVREAKKEETYDINELHNAYQQGGIYKKKKENAIGFNLLEKVSSEKGTVLLQEKQENKYITSNHRNMRALDSILQNSEIPVKELSPLRENKKSIVFDLRSEQILQKGEKSEENKFDDKVNFILNGITKNKNGLLRENTKENLMWSFKNILMEQIESGGGDSFLQPLVQEQQNKKKLEKYSNRNTLIFGEKKIDFYDTAEKKINQISIPFFNRIQDKTASSPTALTNFPSFSVGMGLSSAFPAFHKLSLWEKNTKKQIPQEKKHMPQLKENMLDASRKAYFKDSIDECSNERKACLQNKVSNSYYWGEKQGVEPLKINEKRQLFDSSQYSPLKQNDMARDTAKTMFRGRDSKFEKENDFLKAQNTTENTYPSFLSPSSNCEKSASKVHISLGEMNVTVQGNTIGEKEGILSIIQEELPEMTNEIAAKLAVLLSQVFSNMKARPQ